MRQTNTVTFKITRETLEGCLLKSIEQPDAEQKQRVMALFDKGEIGQMMFEYYNDVIFWEALQSVIDNIIEFGD